MKTSIRLSLFALSFAFLSLSDSANADSATWDGNGNLGGGTFDWNNDLNWNIDPITQDFPNGQGQSANLNVNITGNTVINLNQVITIGTMTIGDTSSSGGLSTTTIEAGTGGSLIFNNGASAAVINAASSGTGSGSDSTINANIAIGGNGVLNIGQFGTSNRTLRLNGSISGGNLTKLGGSNNGVVLAGDNTGWTGTITAIGRVQLASDANPNVVTAGNAIVMQGNGTITGQQGFFTQSLAAQTVRVASLAGTGIVRMGADASLNVGAGGTRANNTITVDGASAFLAPGDNAIGTVGNLVLQRPSSGAFGVNMVNGELRIDIAGAAAGQFDSLILDISTGTTTPTLTIANTFDLTLNLTYAPTVGDVFKIVDIEGANAINGKFAQGDSMFASFGGNDYEFAILYNSALAGGTGNDIVLQVVPEPGAVGLLGFGAALLSLGARARSRRRNARCGVAS